MAWAWPPSAWASAERRGLRREGPGLCPQRERLRLCGLRLRRQLSGLCQMSGRRGGLCGRLQLHGLRGRPVACVPSACACAPIVAACVPSDVACTPIPVGLRRQRLRLRAHGRGLGAQ